MYNPGFYVKAINFITSPGGREVKIDEKKTSSDLDTSDLATDIEGIEATTRASDPSVVGKTHSPPITQYKQKEIQMNIKTETFTNSKTAKSAQYTVNVVESMDDLISAFKGELDKLFVWATANLPENRNNYQTARLSTEPPVKTLAAAAIKLLKTGLEQFSTIEACVATVCTAAPDLSADVLKEAKNRITKADATD